MAKGLPYFKFTPTEWLTGDISFESFEIQGLFIQICAIYWQRDGVVSIEDLRRRFKGCELINEITDRFFSVSDGLISVKFLDEQLIERNHLSTQNKINGQKGGRPKALVPLDIKPTAKRTVSETKAKLTNIEEEVEEEEEVEVEVEKKSIEERKLKFSSTLKPFLEMYGKKLLNEFYAYWTEPNISGTKFKKELERTWDIKRRLEVWSRNSSKFDKPVITAPSLKPYVKPDLSNF